jgi:hypothetical protein
MQFSYSKATERYLMDDGKNGAPEFPIWWPSRSREKRLLYSLCLFFHPSASIRAAPTERFSMKFDLCDFDENMSRKFKFV